MGGMAGGNCLAVGQRQARLAHLAAGVPGEAGDVPFEDGGDVRPTQLTEQSCVSHLRRFAFECVRNA